MEAEFGIKEPPQIKSYRKVLFLADVVGSVALKESQGEIAALNRIFLHNVLARQEIVKESGSLVKYLGDGVLASFNLKKGARQALNAASSLIRQLSSKKSKISTRVVIHRGDVFFWKWRKGKGETKLDPQGTSVDILFRLSKLTPDNHIMVSETVMGSGTGFSLGEKYWFSVNIRGAGAPIRVAIFDRNKTPLPNPELKYEIALRDRRATWGTTLEQLVAHTLGKEWSKLDYLVRNPGQPIQDDHLKALLLYFEAMSKGRQGIKMKNWKALAEANALLKQAIQLYPESPHFYLQSGYHLLMWEADEESNKPPSPQGLKQLRLAQEFSQNALHLFYEAGDWRSSSVRKVMNNIAYGHYLMALGSKGKARAIEKAEGLRICKEIDHIRKLVPTELDAETLDTWGVLLALDSREPTVLNKALGMLEDSQSLRRKVGERSPLVSHHYTEVLQRLREVEGP